MRSASTLNVRVWRGAAAGSYQTFEVPRHASQTVLDVVTYIQRSLDPTLAYRFACRVGMCGSCAMTVNGVARWTCRTHIDKVVKNDRIEIAPLRNLPVILLGQLEITIDALANIQGAAARARLRGQLAGLLGLPRQLRKRQWIQARRQLDDTALSLRLSQDL